MLCSVPQVHSFDERVKKDNKRATKKDSRTAPKPSATTLLSTTMGATRLPKPFEGWNETF